MPSILSLAFPVENPSLNRTCGAIVPVFLFVGLALDSLLTGLGRRPGPITSSPNGGEARISESENAPQVRRSRPVLTFLVMAGLLFASFAQNYDLVFHQYNDQYRLSAWNTSEMGAILKQFALTQGSPDNVWIIPYPFWVDTRLPQMWAGFPERADIAIRPENLAETLSVTQTKLFMFKPEDTQTMAMLRELYPQGTLNLYQSDRVNMGKDFYLFFVPAVETISFAP
jgi:hypothetical protein